MGGARSTVERHPERSRIEAALRAGTPATHVAEQFNLSRQAVSRHRVKLAARPAGPADAGDGERAAVRRQLMQLFNETTELMTKAKDANAPRAFLAAAGEARKLLNAIDKLMGRLDAAPAAPADVAGNVNTEEMQAVIMAALSPFAEARQAVAKALVEHHEAGGEE